LLPVVSVEKLPVYQGNKEKKNGKEEAQLLGQFGRSNGERISAL